MNSFDDPGELLIHWYRKDYHCPDCSFIWSDEWSCACNDRCPNCNLECEPVSYEDFSRTIEDADRVFAARRVYYQEFGSELDHTTLPQLSDQTVRDVVEAQLEDR